MSLLEQFITSGVFAFIIVFVRFGTTMMIMPGIGDSFVPNNIRLIIALAFSFAVFPMLQPYVPNPIPPFGDLIGLLTVEFLTGLFIGTIARILIMSLDTAGMLISLASGISNAQIFNPSLATQGSIFGAFFSVAGTTLLFATDLDHLLVHGLFESYHMFPIGGMLDTGGMAEMMSKVVAESFMIGFQIALPFIIIALILYVGMGVLSRLMPQVQILMVAIPLQILLALVTLSLVLSASMLFFIQRYEEGMVYFLQGGA